jgi:hypothetical protein
MSQPLKSTTGSAGRGVNGELVLVLVVIGVLAERPVWAIPLGFLVFLDIFVILATVFRFVQEVKAESGWQLAHL